MTLFTMLLVMIAERLFKLGEHWHLDHRLEVLFRRIKHFSMLRTLLMMAGVMVITFLLLRSLYGLFFNVPLLVVWILLGVLCIGAGKVRIIKDVSEMDKVQPGDVLVSDMTDPDWEPVMKRASAIVTNRGGRTCHAAIIARELGIPAVVGCGDATDRIEAGQLITVSCAEGDTGFIYDGELDFDVAVTEVGNMPRLPIKIMMNVGNPDRAFDFAQLPNAGVGLARLEFIINRMIGVHPKALLEFDKQSPELQATIAKMIAGYDSPREYYVAKLSEGIATLTTTF